MPKELLKISETGLNNVLGPFKNGFIALTPYRDSADNETNTTQFEHLKATISNNRYKFIPIWGVYVNNRADTPTPPPVRQEYTPEENPDGVVYAAGYGPSGLIDDSGLYYLGRDGQGNVPDPSENLAKKPALFIPNRYSNHISLLRLGKWLCEMYEIDHFLFKPNNTDDTAFLLDQNGEELVQFTDKKLKDLLSAYFTDLVNPQLGSPGTEGEPVRPFSVVDRFYAMPYPSGINDRIMRLNEYYFRREVVSQE